MRIEFTRLYLPRNPLARTALALLGLVLVGLLSAFALAATALAVVALGGVAAWRRLRGTPGRSGSVEDGIIEGEFRVIDDPSRPRLPLR